MSLEFVQGSGDKADGGHQSLLSWRCTLSGWKGRWEGLVEITSYQCLQPSTQGPCNQNLQHAAEVEQFFSTLGGVQSTKQSHLMILHLKTLDTLRNHYTWQLHEEALRMGKST